MYNIFNFVIINVLFGMMKLKSCHIWKESFFFEKAKKKNKKTN